MMLRPRLASLLLVPLLGACASGSADENLPPPAADSAIADSGAESAVEAEVDTAPPQTCVDSKKNGSESDVDCGGGSCPKCVDGKACGAGSDCVSLRCVGGRCEAATCSDGVTNGSETDVDCGGSCPPCATNAICGAGGDCASGVCTGGKCAAPNCGDGIENGKESDVDCGGGACPPCADGKACVGSSDCASGKCASAVCAPATCTDGMKNGKESDVDCGGGVCPGCAVGLACATAADCAGAECVGFKCAHAASCKALHAADASLPSGVYTIDPDGAGAGAPFAAYCDMAGDGGGWTLVLKANGAATTFGYDSALWTNSTLHNAGSPALDANEAKLQGYLSVSFTALRVGMTDAGTTRWLVVPVSASSMLDLVGTTNTYRATTLGRAAWKTLLASPSLQASCGREGINAYGTTFGDPWPRVRIGILGNQEDDCASPDSWIGIGGRGAPCGGDATTSVGNVAGCASDDGDRSTKAFGYVMVR